MDIQSLLPTLASKEKTQWLVAIKEMNSPRLNIDLWDWSVVNAFPNKRMEF